MKLFPKNQFIIFSLVTFLFMSCSKNDLKSESDSAPCKNENSGISDIKSEELIDCSEFSFLELQKKFEQDKSDQGEKIVMECYFYQFFVEPAYINSDLKPLKNKILDENELEIRIGSVGFDKSLVMSLTGLYQ